MACDCIRLTNEALAEHNTELNVRYQFSPSGKVTYHVAIETNLVAKKRGASAMRVLASYCPFCGVKYESDETEPPSRPGAGLGARA